MKKIAIIGGGVSGLCAAHHLSKHHQVTLFEKASEVGGHACSIGVENDLYLDIAFLVFNSHAYPRFIAWMEELGLTEEFLKMEMSFGIETNGFSYSINNQFRGLNLLKNSVKPEFWKLLTEIRRYRREIKHTVNLGNTTIGEHFRKEGYSEFFIQNFIYPLAISIWSLPTESIDKMLAQTFCQFMGHHRFLKENFSARWLTLRNSSKSYKDKVLEDKKFEVTLNADISDIDVKNDSVIINGSTFDSCLIATQADEAAALINDDRTQILSQFSYQKVKAFLHSDQTYMPADEKVWSAWNILNRNNERYVTYYLNKIRPVSGGQNYFLTLCENFSGKNIITQKTFRHLILNDNAFAAQEKLISLNRGPIAFAGSYFGKGFHEDAIESSYTAVQYLMGRPA